MNFKAIEQAEKAEALSFEHSTDEKNKEEGDDTPSGLKEIWANQDEEALEKMHREQCELDRRIDESRRTQKSVYDPGERKENTVSYCEKKYGAEIAETMYQAKESGGQVDKATYAEIMKISARKVEKRKKDQQKKGRQKDKDETIQFIMLSFNLLDNASFRKEFSSKILVYLWLRRHIIRGRMKHDRLKLYDTYYVKGKLASSISYRQIARDLGISPTTVRKHIKELKDADVIEINKVKPYEAWDNQKHYIYVLGTHIGNKGDSYFIDEVYKDTE